MSIFDTRSLLKTELTTLYLKKTGLKLKCVFSKDAERELAEVDKKIAELKARLMHPWPWC